MTQIFNVLLVLSLGLASVVSEVPNPINTTKEVQSGANGVSSHTDGLLLTTENKSSKQGKGRKTKKRNKHRNRHAGAAGMPLKFSKLLISLFL